MTIIIWLQELYLAFNSFSSWIREHYFQIELLYIDPWDQKFDRQKWVIPTQKFRQQTVFLVWTSFFILKKLLVLDPLCFSETYYWKNTVKMSQLLEIFIGIHWLWISNAKPQHWFLWIIYPPDSPLLINSNFYQT